MNIQHKRSPSNHKFRIANSGNVVCNNRGYTTEMGSRGAHVKVLARPIPQIKGEYIAEFGAHRDRVVKAANLLNVTIHRYTRKTGYEIHSSNA